MELTILMPCLNERRTIAICIQKANLFLQYSGIEGEILIADIGSTDGSLEIAEKSNVRVIKVPERGYGSALIAGCNAADGNYVIMGDADDSYDFSQIMPFVGKLREGNDLVIGNRFKGNIESGAMPFLHKYIGNPIITFLARTLFPSDIGDYCCGLRGYNRERILDLHLTAPGMEYASEMIVKATLENYKIVELPVTLKKDGRDGPSHLRCWRDGWRHLKLLLTLYFR